MIAMTKKNGSMLRLPVKASIDEARLSSLEMLSIEGRLPILVTNAPHDRTAPHRAPLIPTLRRFLPYLWPADAPMLRLRIVVALLLVLASKLVQVYGAPFALQGAIDGMGA